MADLVERQIELPDPLRTTGRIVWDISKRGLEWSGGRSSAAWMPFACMRRVTLGKVLGSWRIGLSGPPGSVLIGESHSGQLATPEDHARFVRLAGDIVREASGCGCGPKFRLNDRPILPIFLWSRLGKRVDGPEGLLSKLEVSLK